MARTKFLDYDARPRPKTYRYCVKCQKDLKPGARVRIVRVDDVMVIHPEDVQPGVGGDCLIGLDCAKQLGLEWSREVSGPTE